MLKAVILLALLALSLQDEAPVDMIRQGDIVLFSQEDTQTIIRNPGSFIKALKYKDTTIFIKNNAKLTVQYDPNKASIKMVRYSPKYVPSRNGIMAICRKNELYLSLDPFATGYAWIAYNQNGQLLYFTDNQGNLLDNVYGKVVVPDKSNDIDTAWCYVDVEELLTRLKIDDPETLCTSARAKLTSLLYVYRDQIQCWTPEEQIQRAKIAEIRKKYLMSINHFK